MPLAVTVDGVRSSTAERLIGTEAVRVQLPSHTLRKSNAGASAGNTHPGNHTQAGERRNAAPTLHSTLSRRNCNGVPMNPREQRGIVIAALCKLTQQDGAW